MRITLILCTYNRSARLAKALESTARLEMPRSIDWEVLVVDNKSTDDTRAVVEGYVKRFPDRFRYVFEGRQGKSYALNTGIRKSDADILAFLDDDLIVERTWLQKLTWALHDGQWAGAGGRILPELGVTLPGWIPRDERYGLAPLTVFDQGPESGPLTEPPFGASMAFRREMFDKYGDFRTDLGPPPSTAQSEDTEFGGRLLAGGERLRYEAAAVAYHAVTEDRLRQRYFLDWWYRKGRADVRQSGIPSSVSWSCFGVPLVLLRRLGVWTVRWVVAAGPARRFSCKRSVWTTLGAIRECYAISHGGMRDRQPPAPHDAR